MLPTQSYSPIVKIIFTLLYRLWVTLPKTPLHHFTILSKKAIRLRTAASTKILKGNAHWAGCLLYWLVFWTGLEMPYCPVSGFKGQWSFGFVASLYVNPLVALKQWLFHDTPKVSSYQEVFNAMDLMWYTTMTVCFLSSLCIDLYEKLLSTCKILISKTNLLFTVRQYKLSRYCFIWSFIHVCWNTLNMQPCCAWICLTQSWILKLHQSLKASTRPIPIYENDIWILLFTKCIAGRSWSMVVFNAPLLGIGIVDQFYDWASVIEWCWMLRTQRP